MLLNFSQLHFISTSSSSNGFVVFLSSQCNGYLRPERWREVGLVIVGSVAPVFEKRDTGLRRRKEYVGTDHKTAGAMS